MPRRRTKIAKTIDAYVAGVMDGSVVASSWVRKAAQRHLEDMDSAKDRGLKFDQTAAEHAIEFFGLLKHSKGEWAGEQFKLAPWQMFILWSLYGWKDENGFRRYRYAYVSCGRKQGKTTLAAGLGLHALIADGESGAEVYTAATKRDQARISHLEASRMVKASESLRDHVNVFKDNLSVDGTASKYEPLAADYNSLDGLNISMCVIDELHAWKSREMWDVLDTSTAARRQPLIFIITTAGHDRSSVCWEQHEYSQKVLDGVIEDDSWFVFIAAIDEGDDWEDESIWGKANPNLGVSCKIEDLRRKAKRAKETPAALNAFLRLHLGIWTESETVWLTKELIDFGEGETDAESLLGRKCYAGLDLAATRDLSACVLAFPSDDGSYDLLSYCWAPRENARKRERDDRVPYLTWAAQGHIKLTEGDVTDYDFILSDIESLAERYQIQNLAFDRFGAAQIVTSLQNVGLPVLQWGQGYLSMSPPTKELERLMAAKRIRYAVHPIFKWCMSNVVVETDPAGNIKPSKRKSNERIDLAVSAIMAIGAAMKAEPDAGFVYNERGLLSV